METFVLRVWTPSPEEAELEGGAAQRGLHGFLEHVGSDRREAFHTAGELIALVESAVESNALDLRLERARQRLDRLP
jgi:hypothetical protein